MSKRKSKVRQVHRDPQRDPLPAQHGRGRRGYRFLCPSLRRDHDRWPPVPTELNAWEAPQAGPRTQGREAPRLTFHRRIVQSESSAPTLTQGGEALCYPVVLYTVAPTLEPADKQRLPSVGGGRWSIHDQFSARSAGAKTRGGIAPPTTYHVVAVRRPSVVQAERLPWPRSGVAGDPRTTRWNWLLKDPGVRPGYHRARVLSERHA
jgi:hypothetical protein